MKATVYRTSDDSPLVPALIEAAEDGKQSVCLVELKARFDEHRNIEWSRALEQAGVHVVYGFSNLKIHAKTTLVVRREGDELKRYVHVGTGNYHARTARGYEDFGLFTADEEIAADVADLFNYLTGFGRPQRVPQDPRRAVRSARAADRADPRGREARQGRPDPDQGQRADRSARSSTSSTRRRRAGAQIEIVARSICTLRPGVPGLSETIRVRSVLGRFLEHSRLFIFETPDDAAFSRQRRPDAAQPRQPRRGRRPGRGCARAAGDRRGFSTCCSRTTRRRGISTPTGAGRRARPRKGERARPAQAVLMRNALARARRRLASRRG